MNQDQLKQWVGRKAAEYVLAQVGHDAIIGVGTGSTANCFIDALAELDPQHAKVKRTVSSSLATTRNLEKYGFVVLDPNAVTLERLPIYVDGADEIDEQGRMIKGGGGALSREKIVASMAAVFLCIADESKRVSVLGNFPLPIEVLPMARRAIALRMRALGGTVTLRAAAGQAPLDAASTTLDATPHYQTDNGNPILDVAGLHITDPLALEQEINGWPGVVTVGLFAARGADRCLFGTAQGVREVVY
ncbi:MAG: ribose-5-phosphate isomerase RpiA [Janthinobacterium lividum]